MSLAYAVRVSPENFDAIVSEAGRKFDRKYLLWWYDKYEGASAYFLRDENSKLDCELFLEEVFFEHYQFRFPKDVATLFREVVTKQL